VRFAWRAGRNRANGSVFLVVRCFDHHRLRPLLRRAAKIACGGRVGFNLAIGLVLPILLLIHIFLEGDTPSGHLEPIASCVPRRDRQTSKALLPRIQYALSEGSNNAEFRCTSTLAVASSPSRSEVPLSRIFSYGRYNRISTLSFWKRVFILGIRRSAGIRR